MQTFILKTEPSEYSFEDLVRDRRAVWDGITNNAALIYLRTARAGDEALIYHTGDERAIVGLARITGPAREDPTNPGVTDKGQPKFAVIDIEPVKPAVNRVTLSQLKADKRFAKLLLVTHGRLSVMPVPAPMDAEIRKLAGL